MMIDELRSDELKGCLFFDADGQLNFSASLTRLNNLLRKRTLQEPPLDTHLMVPGGVMKGLIARVNDLEKALRYYASHSDGGTRVAEEALRGPSGKCPRCGLGVDNNRDGDCAVCHKMSDVEVAKLTGRITEKMMSEVFAKSVNNTDAEHQHIYDHRIAATLLNEMLGNGEKP